MQPHPTEAAPPPPEPTRWSAFLFQIKARCFQARRLLHDFLRPVQRHPKGASLADSPVTSTWSADLWREGESPRERELQLGKVQNLRIAARLLDGLEVPANATWSFWKHLGRTTAGKGYAKGRELREGCLVPQIGGGLCQLSGALYNAALEAGFEIIERHAHSLSSIGSLARIGRDATVFWNYVDLRFRHSAPWRLEVSLTRDQLLVRIRTQVPDPLKQPVHAPVPAASPPPNACATCGLASCFRSRPLDAAAASADRVAVLVDAWWPEWDAFLQCSPAAGRDLFLPLDGARWGKPNYQWNTKLHGSARGFPLLALRRAWATRRLRSEGARRQQALLEWDARLADTYGRSLLPGHSHLIIAQTLLPHLWRSGWLGGRSFDVLMSRLPMQELHHRLDHAAALHPESKTCSDFRAPGWLVHAEAEALAAAHHWITPHTAVAALAAGKAEIIPWVLPKAVPVHPPASTSKLRVVFPASTLCRKGAFELREALRGLPVELLPTGGILEGADFWAGIPLAAPDGPWWQNAHVVVLPAFVEHAPRPLLRAIAAGIPVICTRACGLPPQQGLTLVDSGHASDLRAALLNLIAARKGARPMEPALIGR